MTADYYSSALAPADAQDNETCQICHEEESPTGLDRSSNWASMHGVGPYQQGLIATAVCSDYHTAHNVREFTDLQSSIHRNNIRATCQQCRGHMEEVHRKVIRGELWDTIR